VEVGMTGEVPPDWSLYATDQFLDARQISGADTLRTTDPATGEVTVVPTVVGRKIENVPEHTFSLASQYRLSGLLPGFSVNGAAYYFSERAVNQFNQAFIPGCTLFDFGVAYNGMFRGIETTIRATAQNVVGKEYFSSTGANIIAEAPPRTVKLSITTRF
jgi:iron complex outermembrane receptor protein